MKHFVRYCVFLIFYFSINHISFAQKPILDTSIFDNWPHVSDSYISNDGNYFIYTLHNETKASVTTIIKGITKNAEWYLPAISSQDCKLTDDSKKVFFLTGKDSLCQLSLSNNKRTYILGVTEFVLFMHGKIEYLLYQQKDIGSNRTLVIRRLDNLQEHRFNGIERYNINTTGNVILLESKMTVNGKDSSVLTLVRLPFGNKQIIYKGESISGDIVFDQRSEQLAFISISPKVYNQIIHTVWYYKVGAQRSIQLLNDDQGIINQMQLGRLLHFSKKRSDIYCWVRETDLPVDNEDAVNVDVWHYKDVKLQSQQLKSIEPNYFLCTINVLNGNVKKVSEINETVTFDEDNNDTYEERLIVTLRKGDRSESYWNLNANSISHIIYGDDMKRKRLINNSRWIILPPSGEYVYEYDSVMKDLFSFNINNGELHNISQNIPIPLVDSSQDIPNMKYFRGLLPAGWLSNNVGILLNDGFDIWNVDPKGDRNAICLTNEYGRRNNISFSFAISQEKKVLDGNERLILKAFDNNTKKSGFYSFQLDQKTDPKLLTMDSCTYELVSGTDIILKARDVELYIVSRGSAKNSPNFYYTKDFKTFNQLTKVHPEEHWNWLSSELVSWSAPTGETLHGILYKPENFNPSKKYPIIFLYYEILSNNLYRYQQPEETRGLLNIPWFVSHGYLVFTPDIHFKIGYPGESALKVIESAAKYISKFPWVDSAHMGLQGHSWSGYQTAYLVTHSELFAAASEGAGPTNFIGISGATILEGIGARFFLENDQSRIGNTLWNSPELYVKNSPIFSVDKVNTPLLIRHSKSDGIVPFTQGVELFTALRRLGKKAWMLQYDNGNHRVGGKDAADFTIRMTQFFDYYLKQALPPKWMTKGIPTTLKEVDTGLILDSSKMIP